jgi:hypothetical protein
MDTVSATLHCSRAPLLTRENIMGLRHRPDELATACFASLRRIPTLVATAAENPWSAAFTACTLSATAAAKCQHELAEALLDLVKLWTL